MAGATLFYDNMSSWKSFKVKHEYIGMRTEKSTLVQMPPDSIYMGYQTWISNKLVRESDGDYTIAIRPGFDVVLELVAKDENGTLYSVHKKKISGDEFREQFL